MERYKKFIAFWVVNVVLLNLFVAFLPQHYTLGNSFLTPLQAAIISGLVWNLVIWYTEPFFKDLDIELKNPNQMMVAYLTMNFLTLWLLARMAVITGLGISSWLYVLGLAVVANFVQYLAWKGMENK